MTSMWEMLFQGEDESDESNRSGISRYDVSWMSAEQPDRRSLPAMSCMSMGVWIRIFQAEAEDMIRRRSNRQCRVRIRLWEGMCEIRILHCHYHACTDFKFSKPSKSVVLELLLLRNGLERVRGNSDPWKKEIS